MGRRKKTKALSECLNEIILMKFKSEITSRDELGKSCNIALFLPCGT